MKGFFTKEERIAYGLRYEPVVLPVISKTLSDEIIKTDYCFSLMDFQGKKTWSELKVRSNDYCHTDKCMKEGWLIPAGKMIWGCHKVSEGFEVWFFYLWERDGSLWAYKFNPEDTTRFKIGVPDNHADNQLHYWIPEIEWDCIANLDLSKTLQKPKKCLIEDDD
jgi:hypothetical protein